MNASIARINRAMTKIPLEVRFSRVEAHCLQSGAAAYDFDSYSGAKRFP